MSLDLGELLGSVDLIITPFEQKYGRVVGMMSRLGVQAEKTGGSVAPLESGLAGVATSSEAAATGLGGATTALTEAGLSASEATVAIRSARDVTTEAGLASSKLTQAMLRQQAAQERLTALQTTGTASTRQLAAAQATLIAAEDRVVLAQERLGAATGVVGRSKAMWAAVPGPAKVAAAAIAFAGVEALKAASNYQKLTVNLVTGAGESQRNLKMVSDGMLHMAGQVGDSADALAKAMFLVESAGFHGAAGLTLLKTAAEGAKVDNADLTVVVDALTSAMNAYHEPAAHAAQVTNTLIASAAVGKMHLQDLTQALGTVLPSAAALRVPLDQVGAAMATMTMQGTNADRAATYLRFAFAALANPTSKASRSMQQVGLTSQQVATTMTHGGLPAVFTLLQTAVGEKFPAGSAKYLAALANMVGGTRGLQAVLELTGQNLTTMERNLRNIQDRVKGAGNSVSDWAEVQKNLNQQWSEFIDGLGAAGIEIGRDLVPVATDLLRVLNDTGHVAGDVTRFFKDNETAASALAVVLLMTLQPALARVAFAAGTMVKSLVAGRIGAAGAAMKGLGVAGLAARVGVAAVAIEALNAVQDLRHLNDGVNTLRNSMHAPLKGDLLTDLDKAQRQLFDSMSRNVIASMSGWQAFSTGLVHPVTAIKLITGASDDSIKGMSATIDNAYGNFHDLVTAIKGFPTPEAETQMAMVLKAMGVSAADLGTKNFPQLEQSVLQWMAANTLSHHPAQQAHADIVALGSGALSAADEVKALTAALDLFAGNAISADQGAIAFRNDIAALDKALKHSHGSLTLNTQAGRDARDAFDSAAQQALNTAEAEAKLKGGADKARATLEDEIRTLKAHAGSSDYAKAAIGRLENALNNLPAAARTATDALAAAGSASKAAGRHIGYDFGHGMVIGLSEQTGAVEAQAAKLAMSAAIAAKHAHQSRSPSKVAMRIGRDFGAGLALGIEGSGQMVAGAAVRVAADAAAAVRGALGGSGPTGTGVTYQQLTRPAREATELMREVTRANNESADAAKRHAQALSDDAHQAHEAAANMRGNTKAAEKAKHAAEVHARALDDEARAATQAASKIGTANTQNEQALQHLVDVATKLAGQVRQVEQQVSGSLLSSLDLSNAVVNGRVANVSGFLDAGVTPLRRLSHDEARLRKMGLDPDLIAQIAGAGPNAGFALAQNILSGRSGSIHHLDVLERQARHYAKATGRTVAAAEYGRASLDELRKLNASIHAVRRLLEENPHATGREIAAALDAAMRGAQQKHHARVSH